MKHQNITLSLPADLNFLLHARIPRGELSRYVAEVLKKALGEGKENEDLKLERAYELAEKDRDRQELLKDWKLLDEVDDVEGWEWEHE